jgi:hypothetical protein
MLDLISAIASTVHVAILTAGMLVAGGTSTTLRRLTRAIRLLVAACAVKVVALVADALDIPDDGAFWALLSLFTLAASAMVLRLTVERREHKGRQVVADAERTVREWNPLQH